MYPVFGEFYGLILFVGTHKTVGIDFFLLARMPTPPYMELLTSLMFYASVVALGIKASHYSLMCLIIHIRLCDTEEFPLSVSTNS